MKKRYGIVACALLLWVGSARIHCAQAQQKDNDAVPSKVKKQQNKVQQVVYGYVIPQGGMAAEEYKALLCHFRQKEATDRKNLDNLETIYRAYFDYLEGEPREKAVVNTIDAIKIYVINTRMREIYTKVQALEAEEGGEWFAAWASGVAKK